MSKDGEVDSSLSERPEPHRPRRLVDWLNPTGARKVHSLIDKVYKRKNLEIAWERVRANQGAGGIDGESIAAFGDRCEARVWPVWWCRWRWYALAGSGGGAGERLGWRVLAKGPLPCCACQPASPR
jgi:hypothetical protein